MIKHVVVWKIKDSAQKAARANAVKDRAALDAYQKHPLHQDAEAIVSLTGPRAVNWEV